MNSVAKYVDEFDRLLPGFAAFWSENGKLEGGESVHSVFTDASTYVGAEFAKQSDFQVQPLFSWIESVVAGSDEDACNAACTCFLENLLNITGHQINFRQWIPYLGPKSVWFCKSWDEFTGVRTAGLWEL